VAGLTAVEVDTEAHAEELVRSLERESSTRPTARLDLVCEGQTVQETLQRAREAVRDWEPEEGVLFLIDRTRGIETEDADSPQVEFWRRMNLQRESWGALPCHTLFFLKPGNYSLFLTVADDLADWFSLRFHLLGESSAAAEYMDQPIARSQEGPGIGLLPPRVARQQIEALEPALSQAVESESPEVLARRYYLPLMAACLSLGRIRHAAALRERVDESALRKADLPRWWYLNIKLDLELHNLSEARETAEALLEYARDHDDERARAIALFNLGRIAEVERDLERAEKCYRESLRVAETLGDEAGAGVIYHQLGLIAQERGELDHAENWYRKSLDRAEELGDEHGMAVDFLHMGTIAKMRGDFAKTEEWYRKCLEIWENLGHNHDAALTRGQMGLLAQERERYAESARWFIEAIRGFEASGDAAREEMTKAAFLETFREAPPALKPKLRQIWEEAELGAFPDEGEGEESTSEPSEHH
jgi:tetratricopeptide (TPR) repeat protein